MRPIFHRKSTHGFTAIEIAMVASVIAVLAVLIIPLFRDRSEEAKSVAARDELQSLHKALALAEADTGKLFRLQDLDNGIVGSNAGIISPDVHVPIATWNATLLESVRSAMVPPTGSAPRLIGASYWRGPYIAFQKSVTYGFIRASTASGGRPYLLRSNSPDGPIYDITGANANGFVSTTSGTVFDSDDDRMPVDPWGNPYILISLAETGYGPRLLYSMGPDGLPGPNPSVALTDPTNALHYFSWRTGGQGLLGYPGSDDLEYVF